MADSFNIPLHLLMGLTNRASTGWWEFKTRVRYLANYAVVFTKVFSCGIIIGREKIWLRCNDELRVVGCRYLTGELVSMLISMLPRTTALVERTTSLLWKGASNCIHTFEDIKQKVVILTIKLVDRINI